MLMVWLEVSQLLGTGVLLQNDKGGGVGVKSIGVRDSNEVVLVILEGLRIYPGSFHESLVVENDFSNAISQKDSIP